jgi:hypothetical protein
MGVHRGTEPKTEAARKAVGMLAAGEEIGSTAFVVGISHQAVERLWFRWIVWPRMQELERENAELRSQIRRY